MGFFQARVLEWAPLPSPHMHTDYIQEVIMSPKVNNNNHTSLGMRFRIAASADNFHFYNFLSLFLAVLGFVAAQAFL